MAACGDRSSSSSSGGGSYMAVAVAEATAAQSSSSSFIIVVILFLLDHPPHRHCPSPFCCPQLFLQASAHPPSTHRQPRQKQPKIVVHRRCSSSSPSSSLLGAPRWWDDGPHGGRRTTMTAIARMKATDRPPNCRSLSHSSLAANVVTSSPNCLVQDWPSLTYEWYDKRPHMQFQLRTGGCDNLPQLHLTPK